MRSLSFVLAGLTGLTGCFGDTQQPATFRFECKSDGDCTDPEQCIDSLCQVPCTYASFEDDCPGDTVTCFNGLCSNLCELDGRGCPGTQDCLEVPIDPGAGGFGGVDTSNLGICGSKCSADSCPDGELCLEGICVPLAGGETTGGTGD